jgi:hypothetical protein
MAFSKDSGGGHPLLHRKTPPHRRVYLRRSPAWQPGKRLRGKQLFLEHITPVSHFIIFRGNG